MHMKLVDILVCPLCKGKLSYYPKMNLLVCRMDRLAYSIHHGIPIMLEQKARQLSLEELEEL